LITSIGWRQQASTTPPSEPETAFMYGGICFFDSVLVAISDSSAGEGIRNREGSREKERERERERFVLLLVTDSLLFILLLFSKNVCFRKKEKDNKKKLRLFVVSLKCEKESDLFFLFF